MKKLLQYIGLTIILTFGISGVASANSTTYQVKNGDSLWGISKKFHITIQQIKSWNKLTSDNIKPNQVLRIAPVQAKKAAAKTQPAYKEITVTATAYTASCKGCSGMTATGLNLKKNPSVKAISVDPKVIPLGSKVYVEGYGYAVAADTGSSVKGNKIDVFISNKAKAYQWGVKKVKVKIMK